MIAGRGFVVRADLPGLSRDDVQIEAADDSVIIGGERRSEIESQEQGGAYRSERVYGRFSRVIPLPAGAETIATLADMYGPGSAAEDGEGGSVGEAEEGAEEAAEESGS